MGILLSIILLYQENEDGEAYKGRVSTKVQGAD